MNYCVLHSEKGTGGSGGIGNHIDRKPGYEHTCLHSFPEKKHLNQNFALTDNKHEMSLPEAIDFRIKQGYNGKRKIRTDAVKFNTHILSGSHEKMIEIFKDKQKADEWIKANYDFISSEFGEKNIVRFTLHMDEKTPHIHAVTVPIAKDGRLSSKQILGNPTTLRNRQDTYGLKMKPFGLERGERNSGIKHEDAKKYYERMALANKSGDDIDGLSVSNKFIGINVGLNKEKTIESLKTALSAEKTLSKSKELALKAAKKQYDKLKEKNIVNRKVYDLFYFNDKKREELKAKRIIEIQKLYRYELKRELRSKNNIYQFNQPETDKLIHDLLVSTSQKEGIIAEAYGKIITNKIFAGELAQMVMDKIQKNQEKELNKGKNRGYSRSL